MAISLLGGGAAQPADNTSDIIKNTTTATFVADVIEASHKVPVIVDFWAQWCGPCKQLTPILEKVVRASKGKVRLVKMNIDEHPEVAGQLQIQSIPAVFAFSQGQPVDGFMGALPESQVKAFVQRLIGPDADDAAGVEEAQRLFEEGDIAGAAQLYGAVLKNDRENADAIGGLSKCYVRLDDLARAEQVLSMTPPAKQTAEAYLSAKAALELAKKAEPSADTAPLEKAIAANPRDWDARFKLALALVAKGKREDALDHLFEIVRKDRAWNDDAARQQLVELFEAWGPKDPLTQAGRQRLSSILFA
ncbi:thioredoxin [Rhodomicrobium vannielii ATCC 17100]|uniref:Thioredoxin n=1 Tax=Rhodomicrobium vannielii (strain ATCC 17100 / DSM 162 / LMG 4299 / NCIMB 10020 / ATH 3.1.1) TaxID=648757 RepID=E3HZX0_RHOVT|nr:thioredoxin [Rhodomicrobium vannielii]ADP69921.1 thioredoxin [Rhodomicrobium vannielii ATCC 17100]